MKDKILKSCDKSQTLRLCLTIIAAFLAATANAACPEIVANKVTLVSNCTQNFDGRYQHGCAGKLACHDGFYFANQQYASGILISCNQGLWIDSTGTSFDYKISPCLPGCPSYEFKNATITKLTPTQNTVRNLQISYYKDGTIIETSCKNGYYFAATYNRNNNADKFRCENGSWIDVLGDCDADGVLHRPGNCEAYCNALTLSNLTNAPFDLQPSNATTITVNGSHKVPYNSLYKIKCNNGKVNIAGFKTQTLTCQIENSYYDADVKNSNATILPCVSSICTNYDNTDSNTVIYPKNQCHRSECGNAEQGCEIVSKCADGYFNRDADYANGLTLLCWNSKWVDACTLDPAKKNQCELGCKAPDLQNATVICSGAQNYTYNENVFYPIETAFETKCKDGYAFADPNNRKRGSDSYTCVGGSSPWKNDNNAADINSAPGQCLQTCTPLNGGQNVVTLIDPAQNGQSITNNGKTWIAHNGEYKFTCADGYVPSNGNNAHQTLICKGDDMGYYNPVTGEYTTSPLLCIATGCIALSATNIDVNSYITSSNGCQMNRGYEKDGCKITIKCKAKTYYFKDDNYGNGQTLTCKSGKWLNQNKKPVNPSNGIYSNKCFKGCPALTLSDMPDAEFIRKPSGAHMVFKNGADEVWADQALVITLRKNNSEDQNQQKKLIEHYICNNGVFTYIQNNISRNPNVTVNTSIAMNRLCRANIDKKVKKCRVINQNNPNVKTSSMGCSQNESFALENCVIKNECKKGSYPKHSKYLEHGNEIITCSPDGKGWLNQFKQVITKPFECNSGCINAKNVNTAHGIVAKYVTKKDYMFVQNFNGKNFTKCISANKIKSLQKIIWRTLFHSHKFYCNLTQKVVMDSIDYYYYNSYCKNTCRQLRTPLPSHVVIAYSPKTFKWNGMQFVASQQNYILKCAPGYEYPRTSFATPRKFQTLRCNGANHFYYDVNTGIQRAPIHGCIPVRGCPVLRKPPDGVIVHYKSCIEKDNVYLNGCKILTTCRKGYYPVDKTLWPTEGQDLTCNLTVNSNFITNDGKPVTEFLICRKGCVKKSHNVSLTDIEESKDYTTVTDYRGQILAKCVSTETIKHKTVDRSHLNSKYYCRVSPKELEKANTYYDGYCSNACKTLQEPLPFGVVIKHKPPYFSHGSNTYVIANARYELTCPRGYSYPANDPHASSGVQQLFCNGTSHLYVDKKTGKENLSVAVCQKTLGCDLPAAGSFIKYKKSNCKEKNGVVKFGCRVTVSCKDGYYPADKKYLKPGKQQLTCSTKYTGWIDQFNYLVDGPFTCTKGCIKRNETTADMAYTSYWSKKTYKLPKNLVIECSGSRLAVATTVKSSSEHSFYCKEKIDSGNEASTTTSSISPCANACVAIPTPYGSTVTSSKQQPAIEFAHINYVQTGHKYVFKCSNGNTIKLTCNGGTGKYADEFGNEQNTPPKC